MKLRQIATNIFRGGKLPSLTQVTIFALILGVVGGLLPNQALVAASSGRQFGYSMHTLGVSDPDAYMTKAVNGGAQTTRDEFEWAWIEPSKGVYDWAASDRLMTYAANHGLHMLMIADTTPSWASGKDDSIENWQLYPPINSIDFGNFAGKLAARYGGTGSFWAAHPTLPKVLPAGIEIWNEPNLPRFWTSGPNAVKYTGMLKLAYQKVKAVDPSMTVVTGGLAPVGCYNDADCNGVADNGVSADGINPVNYLKTIYVNGGAGYFDAVGWHPYSFWGTNTATAAEMLANENWSAWSQMGDTATSARSLMIARNDGNKKIWATELGAPTCITGAQYTCVSEAEQAKLATQGVALWKSYSWSGNYYWYDLRDDFGGSSTTDMEYHFGALRSNNTQKPSYAALKTAFTAQ